MKPQTFWVAELVNPADETPYAPAIYWNGHTRPLFEPVTTTDIHEALRMRDRDSVQRLIGKLGLLKVGILLPTEHEWVEP